MKILIYKSAELLIDGLTKLMRKIAFCSLSVKPVYYVSQKVFDLDGNNLYFTYVTEK